MTTRTDYAIRYPDGKLDIIGDNKHRAETHFDAVSLTAIMFPEGPYVGAVLVSRTVTIDYGNWSEAAGTPTPTPVEVEVEVVKPAVKRTPTTKAQAVSG